MDLFTSESEGSDDIDDRDGKGLNIKINQKFAKEYEERKRAQELKKLKDLNIDDELSPSEDEDEGDGLTLQKDLQIMKTIQMIRSKDPTIYNKDAKLYDSDSESESSDKTNDESSKHKNDQHKPKYGKDLIRESVLDKLKGRNKKLKTEFIFDDEQNQLRDEVIKEISNIDDNDGEDLLVQKNKSGTKSHNGSSSNINKINIYSNKLSPDEQQIIDSYYDKKNIKSSDDQFLIDYLKNQKWKDEDESADYNTNISKDSGVDRQSDQSKLVQSDNKSDGASDDEATMSDKLDEFESQYNFRFEHSGSNNIATYARQVPNSMRRKNDKRKRERENKKQRELELKRQRIEELKRLKNLKRKEIEKKLRLIDESMGKAKIKLNSSILEDDFDPEQYDKQMESIFNDEYYDEEDKDFKPDLLYDDEEGINNKESKTKESSDSFVSIGIHPDTEINDELADTEKLSEFNKEKEELLNELYSLDYEDTIGDLKTRFKYREVQREDFGLETEDILVADDTDLRQLIPLKQLAPYREKRVKVNKSKLKLLKKQISQKISELETPSSNHPMKRKNTTKSQEKSKKIHIDKGRLKSYGL